MPPLHSRNGITGRRSRKLKAYMSFYRVFLHCGQNSAFLLNSFMFILKTSAPSLVCCGNLASSACSSPAFNSRPSSRSSMILIIGTSSIVCRITWEAGNKILKSKILSSKQSIEISISRMSQKLNCHTKFFTSSKMVRVIADGSD